jgi:hypothetical protein
MVTCGIRTLFQYSSLINKLMTSWPSNKNCGWDFDTFPFVKANYMVTHGKCLSPLIIIF